jgi:hypothetical protein
MGGESAMRMGGMGGGGMRPMGQTGGGFEGQITPPWTHRVSDSLVDVVHFETAVVIDTERINDFINVLQSEKTTPVVLSDGKTGTKNWRNQITVLLISVDPIQVDSEKAAGYYYGSASLGVLRVVGEYIFFKNGYDKYKPEIVKKMFSPAPAGGEGGPGGESQDGAMQ